MAKTVCIIDGGVALACGDPKTVLVTDACTGQTPCRPGWDWSWKCCGEPLETGTCAMGTASASASASASSTSTVGGDGGCEDFCEVVPLRYRIDIENPGGDCELCNTIDGIVVKWMEPVELSSGFDCFWAYEGPDSTDPDCGGVAKHNWALAICNKEPDPSVDSYMNLQIRAVFDGDLANYKSDSPVCSEEGCLAPISLSLDTIAFQSRCPFGAWPATCTMTPV